MVVEAQNSPAAAPACGPIPNVPPDCGRRRSGPAIAPTRPVIQDRLSTADPFPIRILIADHHTIFRDGLQRLLESDPGFAVVGGAGDAVETMQLVRHHRPDVLLLDLAMPGGGGLEVLQQLAAAAHGVRTLGLTAQVEKAALIAALQCGIRGVVLKEASTAHLFKSIRKVADNQFWIGRDEVGNVIDAMRLLMQQAISAARVNRFRLTRREMDIVAAVVAGESNREIAERLSLKEDTVKHHVSSIFDKVGVYSRLELAVFAIKHQLVKDLPVAS
jgi:two-component system, NarL family, nitrate/nitrite response regulator NarL